MRRSGFHALFLVVCAPIVAQAQLDDPIPAPIAKGNVAIELAPVATGLTAPLQLTTAGGGSGQLFIVDQAGKVRLYENGQLEPQAFLDVSPRLVELGFFGTHDENDFDERGLLGLAFHPGYHDSQSPGFGKFYTYTSEPGRRFYAGAAGRRGVRPSKRRRRVAGRSQ